MDQFYILYVFPSYIAIGLLSLRIWLIGRFLVPELSDDVALSQFILCGLPIWNFGLMGILLHDLVVITQSQYFLKTRHMVCIISDGYTECLEYHGVGAMISITIRNVNGGHNIKTMTSKKNIRFLKEEEYIEMKLTGELK